MNDKEIAMQLTLKAMESNLLRSFRPTSDDTAQSFNQSNAQLVCEFYSAIFEAVSHAGQEKE